MKWIGVILVMVGIVLIGGTIYSELRDLTSVGVHKFLTTGEVDVRQEKENRRQNNSRRSSLVNVTNYYAMYQSEDGKYRFERKFDRSNGARMVRDIKNGGVYSLQRDVFVDRFGKVVVFEPGKKPNSGKQSLINAAGFGAIFVIPGLLMIWLSRRKKRVS